MTAMRWMLLIGGVGLLACGGSSDSDDGDGDAEDDDECAATGLAFASGNADNGAMVFSGFCASCHGADGRGNAGAAAAGSRGSDLHDEISEANADDCIVSVIKNGEDAMAPVAGITDQQILDVLAYMHRDFTE